jgi:hypothetical protein
MKCKNHLKTPIGISIDIKKNLIFFVAALLFNLHHTRFKNMKLECKKVLIVKKLISSLNMKREVELK